MSRCPIEGGNRLIMATAITSQLLEEEQITEMRNLRVCVCVCFLGAELGWPELGVPRGGRAAGGSFAARSEASLSLSEAAATQGGAEKSTAKQVRAKAGLKRSAGAEASRQTKASLFTYAMLNAMLNARERSLLF